MLSLTREPKSENFRMTSVQKFVGLTVLLILVLCIPVFINAVYWLHVLIMIGIYAIAAQGLWIISRIGRFSFGHAAFMGIGAYSSALLATEFGVGFWPGVLGGIVVTTVVALIIGYATLALRGTIFMLTTFAFLEVTVAVWLHWDHVFGGAMGITGIMPLSLFGADLVSKVANYYFVLAMVILASLFVYQMERSSVGRVFSSLRDSERLSQHAGINIMRYKLLGFTIGCIYASVAGCLFAHYLNYVNPGSFGMWPSTYLIAYVMLGGLGFFCGPLVGAVLLILFSQGISGLQEYIPLVYGTILVVIMLFAPDGILGRLQYVLRRLGSSRL